MPILFTPWRYRYIKEGAAADCVFCSAAQFDGEEEKVLRVHRSDHAILMMNRFPYTNGHLMVAPLKHTAALEDLSAEERADLMETVLLGKKLLHRIYEPQGFNIGMNLGRVAGAGIEDHLHVHVVPRWNGDQNFMRVLSDTRLIPEDLSITFAKLKECITS